MTAPTNNLSRIHPLDYLRGLMALMIMFYHYLSWHYEGFDSSHFMGRIGVYGVSIFYILSGLTLYIVYKTKIFEVGYWQYALRRILRIYPLLILITLLTVFLLKNYVYIFTTERPLESLLLNITGLFGFVEPKRYIATGAWSIGNELVFYVFFPIILILTNWKKYMLYVSFLISLIIALYFAYFAINTDLTLSKNWEAYINPFNQIFLFVGGMVIAELLFFNKKDLSWPPYLFLIFLLVFSFYPVSGDRVNIIAGSNRLIFSLCCFGIVVSFLKTTVTLPNWLSFLFRTLGDISYTLYLSHPLVYYSLMKYNLLPENPLLSMIICIITTFFFSVIIYNYIEKPFMRMGRK